MRHDETANTGTKKTRDSVTPESTALVPVKNMGIVITPPAKPNKPTRASFDWTNPDGSEAGVTFEIPNYATMDTRRFVETMAGAADDIRENVAHMGMSLAVVILPGIEDAKRRLRAGETLDVWLDDVNQEFKGENQIGDFVRALGINPDTVRQWKHRLAEKALIKQLHQMGVDQPGDEGGKGGKGGRDSVTRFIDLNEAMSAGKLGFIINGAKFALQKMTGLSADPVPGARGYTHSVDVCLIEVKKSAAKKKEKKERKPIVHIHDERSAISLCEKFVTKKHAISKHFKWAGEANCKACIKVANEKGMPVVLTKEDANPPTVHAAKGGVGTWCGKDIKDGVQGSDPKELMKTVTCKACRNVLSAQIHRGRNRAAETEERYQRMRGKNKAVIHAVNKGNDRKTRCSHHISASTKTSSDPTQVTCGNCERRIRQVQEAAWYAEFEKTVPAGTSEKDKQRQWMVCRMAKQGYEPGATEHQWVPATGL